VIELVTGSPGAGKSFYAVRLIANSVRKGRVVITNVPLVEGWARQLATAGWNKWRREDRILARQRRYESLVYVSEDFNELLKVRVEGDKEGRADLVLDECHRWMNSRMWDQAEGMNRDEAIRVRSKMVAYFSGHRHYGVNVYLITQDERNIDNQVRWLYEYVTRLKNVKRGFKVLGVPLLPINIFVAVKFWNDKVRTKVGVNVFGLDKSVARLYSTHHLGAVDMPADAIWMPRRDLPALVSGDGAEPEARP
jgi:zona occludens toxin (predicted ATPase)